MRSRLLVVALPCVAVVGVVAVWLGTRPPAETIGECLIKARATSISTDNQALVTIQEPKGGSVEFKGQNARSALADALSDDAIREGINACRLAHVAGAATLEPPTFIITATVARANQVRIPGAEVKGRAGTSPFKCSSPTDQNGQCDLTLHGLRPNDSVRVEAYRNGFFLAQSEPTPAALLQKGVVDLVRDRSAEPVVVEVSARECKGGPFRGDVQVNSGEGFVWDAKRDTPPEMTGEGRTVTADRLGLARFNAILASLPPDLELRLDPSDGRETYSAKLPSRGFHDTVLLAYPCPKTQGQPPECGKAAVQLLATIIAPLRQSTPATGSRQAIEIRTLVGAHGQLLQPQVTGNGATADEQHEVQELIRRLIETVRLPTQSCRLTLVSR